MKYIYNSLNICTFFHNLMYGEQTFCPGEYSLAFSRAEIVAKKRHNKCDTFEVLTKPSVDMCCKVTGLCWRHGPRSLKIIFTSDIYVNINTFLTYFTMK